MYGKSGRQSRTSAMDNARLKMLSDTEKAQLLELQKTRERILKELEKHPSSYTATGNYMDGFGELSMGNDSLAFSRTLGFEGSLDMLGNTSRLSTTNGPYNPRSTASRNSRSGVHGGSRREALVSRHSTAGLSNAANYINNLKKGMDMVPILASTGEPAMDVGLQGKGVVRLPVFKLPTLEIDRIRAQQLSRQLDADLEQRSRIQRSSGLGGRTSRGIEGDNRSLVAFELTSIEERFVAYSDLRSYCKAMMLMIASFSPAAMAFTTRYLAMSDAEVQDIESVLKKKADISAAGAVSAVNSPVGVNKGGSRVGSRVTPRSSTIRRTPRTPRTPQGLLPSSTPSASSAAGLNSARGNSDTGVVVGSAGTSQANSKEASILDDFFGVDPNYSVFNLARDVVMDELAERNEVLNTQNKSLLQAKALRNVDLKTVGLSDDFNTFLAIDSSARSVDSFGTAADYNSTALSNQRSHQRNADSEALPPLRRLGSMPPIYHAKMSSLSYNHGSGQVGRNEQYRSSSAQGPGGPRTAEFDSVELPQFREQSSVQYKNSTSSGATGAHGQKTKKSLRRPMGGNSKTVLSSVYGSTGGHHSSKTRNNHHSSGQLHGNRQFPGAPATKSNLTTELLSSLQTMQEHTYMIKKSITEAQNVVSIEDPKARHLLFSVAAERLKVALNPLLLIELRRGFTAWGFSVRQVRRQEKVALLIRFLTYRNLVLGLHEMVQRRMAAKLDIWKQFTQDEIKRIRKERVLNAVIRIQCIARKRAAGKKTDALRMRRKYQRLYDATIKIQALIRGKVTRWRFLRNNRDSLEGGKASIIQRNYRGYRARCRVRLMRLRHDKANAAVQIQKIIRARQAYTRVQRLLELRRSSRAALTMQKLVRGFVTRRNIATRLINRARYRYAARIQALVRGVLGRMHLERKLQEIEEYRERRYKAATTIQALCRGHQARLYYQMMMYKVRKTKDEEYKAATQINKIVRAFNCRVLLRDMKQARLDKWTEDARKYQEVWSEESQNWYYYNNEDGDAVWEPRREGYTRHDGMLVLASGAVIEDPIKVKEAEEAALMRLPFEENGDDAGDDHDVSSVRTGGDKKKLSKLCSECMDRMATRQCNECGDKYCTKCYKYVHATGSRRNHTYAPLGPIDCQECELHLAERWCVSCDESFCDTCWRKVHGRGKRVYHPYSEISPEGRIDARIFTMDGEQVNDYDSSYSQQRVDVDAFNQKQDEVQQLADSLVPEATADGYDQQYNQQYDQQYDQQAVDNQEYAVTVANEGEGGYSSEEGYATEGYDTEGYATEGYESGYDPNYAQEGSYDPWAMYYDEQGYPYYYNAETGVSQYENPYE